MYFPIFELADLTLDNVIFKKIIQVIGQRG